MPLSGSVSNNSATTGGGATDAKNEWGCLKGAGTMRGGLGLGLEVLRRTGGGITIVTELLLLSYLLVLMMRIVRRGMMRIVRAPVDCEGGL